MCTKISLDNRRLIDPEAKINVEEDKCSFSMLNWLRNAINKLTCDTRSLSYPLEHSYTNLDRLLTTAVHLSVFLIPLCYRWPFSMQELS